jgi:hypothetical protein
VRTRLLAVAVLAGLAAGCIQFAFVREPSPPFIGVTMWTDVPEGQSKVKARVGDTLHLPLGSPLGGRGGLPAIYRVKVNDEDIEEPTYCDVGDKVWYVFKATEAGEFEVETEEALTGRSHHVWHITVAEAG